MYDNFKLKKTPLVSMVYIKIIQHSMAVKLCAYTPQIEQITQAAYNHQMGL